MNGSPRSLARWLFLGMVAFSLAGCATQRINWEGRAGTYTYDEAVMEFGPPDKEATLQNGTRVVEWLTHRGSTYAYPSYPAFGYHRYPYWYSPAPPTYVESPDYFLRLTFGPDGKLQAWKNLTK